MKAERDIEKRIKQKEEEVQRLKGELIKSEAYLEAMRESLRLIKKTSISDGNDGIRSGSAVYKARAALRETGKALHVEDLLRSMGKEVTDKFTDSKVWHLYFIIKQNYYHKSTNLSSNPNMLNFHPN